MLARRWYVLVPCLLLTLIGMAVAVATSSQSYDAKGQVVLLAAPTPPEPTTENPSPPSAHNPYSQLDLPDVVDVVSAAVNSDAVGQRLLAEGITGTYTVAGNKDFQRGPIMDLAITTSSERESLAQYPVLRKQVAKSLRDLQLQAGANPDYLITSQEITPPSVQGATALSKLRAAIVVLIVGLIVTLALVFGLEAILRTRKRGGVESTPDDPDADDVAENGVGEAAGALADTWSHSRPATPHSGAPAKEPATAGSRNANASRNRNGSLTGSQGNDEHGTERRSGRPRPANTEPAEADQPVEQ